MTHAPRQTIRFQHIVKRTVDLLLAGVGLLVLAPVFAAISALIALLEGRPIFYRSTRHVDKGVTVPILKFRTMVKDATSPKYDLSGRFMRDGYLDIPLTCEVYTPIGRLLERTQVVEALQLWNVVRDGMSIIGNRPLPSANVQLLARRFPDFADRFKSPAGISGLSQVIGKLNLTPGQRLLLESGYARIYESGNIIKCDLYIMAYTLRFLVSGRPLPFEEGLQLLRRCGEPHTAQDEAASLADSAGAVAAIDAT